MKSGIFLLLFVFCFGIYIYTAPPGLVAYRDAGEMVTVSKTLGIAHPPGYPLYSLLGKLATFFPLGNIAYRTNLISLVAGSLSVSLLFLVLSYLVDLPAAIITALLLATGYLHWYLAIVQEMYSLNILFVVLLLFLVIGNRLSVIRKLYLFSFIFGLALGIRMDILLTIPGFVYLFYRKLKTENALPSLNNLATQLLTTFLLFVLGFSVYLYLPVRSASGPLLDWNHPADLARLWATLSRKTHGGTLDLISQGYSQGANFLPTIIFYFKCLAREYFYLGLPIGIFGFFRLYRKERNIALATFLSWVVSGPVFVYLSNLPPNPHALAILEAHLLLSYVFYLLWVGYGIFACGKYARFVFIPLVMVNFLLHFPPVNKRDNFFVLDYSRNLFSTLEPDSIIVTKKDVQIFSLWNRQLVERKRPDLTVVAQGLSASPWYQEQIKCWYRKDQPTGRNIFLANTKEAETLNQFYSLNERKIYFSVDNELPNENLLKFKLIPQGLVYRTGDERFLNPYEFYALRGEYRYPAHYDFFTPDLIEDYAKGYERIGFKYLKENNYPEAEKNFFYVLTLKPESPQIYSTLGYIYFANNRLPEAEKYYNYSVDTYTDLYRKAEEYRASPEVKEAIKSDISGVYNNLGVVYERQKKEDEAISAYRKAMEYIPANADAQYNIAVIYWKRNDWEKVVAALENVLRINPQHQAAGNYLTFAREKLRERK